MSCVASCMHLFVWTTIDLSDSPDGDVSAACMQVLRNEPTSYAADLWALGCLLYRMLLGETPFAAASEYLIFERITSHDLHVPDTIAPAAQDLLRQLLDSDPKNRIGEILVNFEPIRKQKRGIAKGCACNMNLMLQSAGARSRGLSELREHPFFAGSLHLLLLCFLP
jgi:serine/threonine protein kinase